MPPERTLCTPSPQTTYLYIRLSNSCYPKLSCLAQSIFVSHSEIQRTNLAIRFFVCFKIYFRKLWNFIDQENVLAFSVRKPYYRGEINSAVSDRTTGIEKQVNEEKPTQKENKYVLFLHGSIENVAIKKKEKYSIQ